MPRRKSDDDPFEQLYAVAPDEFVAERNRLARALRDSGDRERAAEIAALRKPTLALFAANRLARDRRGDIAALLAAGRALAEAHEAGDAARLREAQGELGNQVRALVADAREVSGVALSDQLEQRLATTLRAAALDPAGSELLERGTLQEELEPGGFELVAGLTLPRGTRKPARSSSAAPKRPSRAAEKAQKERQRRLEQELREAKDALRTAERALAAAQRDLRRAEERAAKVEERLDRVRAGENGASSDGRVSD